MKKIIITCCLILAMSCFAQVNTVETEITVNPIITGTLYSPVKMTSKTPLVIMIAGSGPTDRYGNQATLNTNCTKLLAEALAENNIAVFSYDKRIIAQMKAGTMDEKTLTFENFIDDARDVLNYFKAQKKYPKIIIAGHSEGSLIGMIVAADANADAFISLAGAGRTIDLIVTEQILKQAPTLKDELDAAFAKLKKGETFELENPMLKSLFRESVQPYLISWIKFNPQTEIKKLKVPTLIINGTKDIQVNVTDAELLKSAKPDATLEIIPDMNHLFKEIKGDDAENAASYHKPELPVMPQLVSTMTKFIKAI